jgi:serine/threonine protein kinase
LLHPNTVHSKTDSTLFRARDELGEYEGEYVVKRLHNVVDSHGNLLGAAEKEAQFRGLDHNNWAKIYDAKADGADFILVTRRYPDTLLSLAGWKPLTLQESWSFADQILRGLMAAWAIPRVHLDIKPSNIAIDEEDVVKIFDWGISKDPEASTGNTTGGPSYTAHYAPPEQIERSENWLHQNADLRALAATWFWMLTGEPPLQREAVAAGVVTPENRISNEKNYTEFLRETWPRPVRTFVPGIPRELDQLLTQWLDPIAERRNPGEEADYSQRLTAEMDRVQKVITDKKIGHLLVGPAGKRDADARAAQGMSQQQYHNGRGQQQWAQTLRMVNGAELAAAPAEEQPTRPSRRSNNGSDSPTTPSTKKL